MDSKEATSHPEASAGSFTPLPVQSSDVVESSSMLYKNIELSDINDDESRNDSKGAVSEDEGYVSGTEEFEHESYKTAMEENSDASFKTQSSSIGEAIMSGDDAAETDNKESEGVEKVLVYCDSVEKAGGNPDGGVMEGAVTEALVSKAEPMVVEGVEMKGEDEIVSLSVEDELTGVDPEVKEVLMEELKLVNEADAQSILEMATVVNNVEVAVVRGAEENGDVVIEPTKEFSELEKAEVASHGDVELTSEGDFIVDHIQVDVVSPGVAVVRTSEDNRGKKAEREEVVALETIGGVTETSNGEAVDETMMDSFEGKPFHNEHVLVAGEKDEDSNAGAHKSIKNDDSVERGEIIHSETAHPEELQETNDGESPLLGGAIEELEQEPPSHMDSSLERAHETDGQIVMDSEEEGYETDDNDEGNGKELFNSSALAALLKAAASGDSNGGNITISSQDGSRLFTVERPAGLGPSLQSLRPGPRTTQSRPSLFSTPIPDGGKVYEENLSEEEKKKLEQLQQIRVKFLRLVHRLGLSPEESVVGQVLYRLALLGGRQNTLTLNLDDAKRMAVQLEMEQRDSLDFSVNILVIGKDGVGKSSTINSIFGDEKAPIDAFEPTTGSPKKFSGLVDGVKVHVVDTPGLKQSVLKQGFNRSTLSSVKKLTKKRPADIVLYVDRLDSQSRDLNDLPLLKTINRVLGTSIWRNTIIALTHSASAPPHGPLGGPLSYEVFVSQRSHVVQQLIGQAVGDLRSMVPSLTNPVSLVENHPSCRKNREGHKILPNGQVWRPQLLLLCYSMKILSEANAISKPQDLFDHRKLFSFRSRTPPLPYILSSVLQSRPHPKLPSDQGGENGDSDIDLNDFSDLEHNEEGDEYDDLPPFKPLRKAQIANLSREQRKAYFEEYDYRVKLLQKKQWKEELKRMKEFKKSELFKTPNQTLPDYDEADSGPAAPIAAPLPDMTLPPSFDVENPTHRYRFLEPSAQFLARPVLDTHGWDHDCGYDGVNIEHSLGILNRFPANYTVQITKDKKDFTVTLDSSIAARPCENISAMTGFDIQSIGRQLAYNLRGEAKIKNLLRRNKATGGVSFTVLGENVVPALKVEDEIMIGKRHTLVGSAGVVRSHQEAAYGANLELQSRDDDYPVGQVRSTLNLSMVKWRGDLMLGLNALVQFGVGRNTKVAVKAGVNSKMSGQVTVRISSSDHLSLALVAVIPTALTLYRKLFPTAEDKYSIY